VLVKVKMEWWEEVLEKVWIEMEVKAK